MKGPTNRVVAGFIAVSVRCMGIAASAERGPDRDRNRKPVFYLIIRTQPETRRETYYFDSSKILKLGLDRAESDELIEELTRSMIQPSGEYPPVAPEGHLSSGQPFCSYHKAAS